MKRTRIVGCGAWHRGDDEAGLLAAEALRHSLGPQVEVLEDIGGGGNILTWCEGVDRLVLIDAALATPSLPAGSWIRIGYPADRRQLAVTHSPHTHLLSLADALRLAETLGLLPATVILFVLAGDQFAPGTNLSPHLRQPLTSLIESIRREVAD